MMTTFHSKRGFALPVAVFGLVVVGVLVTGGFYLARQETRIGMASQRGTAAFYMAERGAHEVMSQWDMSTFGALPNWSTATKTDTVDDGIWTVNVTKMTDRLFFLLSTGTVTQGSAMLGNASRMVGVVARLNTAEILPNAALTTVGDLTIGGSTQVDGHDSDPSMWSGYCGTSAGDKPGVLIDDVDNIKTVGTAFVLDGDPPFVENPALTSDSLLAFGDLQWADLVAMADKIYPSGYKVTQLTPDSTLVGGSYLCNTSILDAWGTPFDPGSACGTHFPIIYAKGNFEIASGDAGQGILLVEGDLDISGGHEFFGPVIIRGTLRAQGGGAGGHFRGGVVAANVILESTTVMGNALVEYSSCSVTRAILNNANLTRARPLESRSWVDLSSVISG
jgi:hypothetical protein